MRRCIFCDFEGRLSDEHVRSEWLQAELLSVRPPNSPIRTVMTHFDPPREFVGDAAVAKVVCRTAEGGGRRGCNDGWMSELEAAVQPILTPMLHDHPKRLGLRAQQLLTSWFTMKSMAAEFVGTVINPSPSADRFPTFWNQVEREHFRTTLIPPTESLIWLARNAEHATSAGWTMGDERTAHAGHLDTRIRIEVIGFGACVFVLAACRSGTFEIRQVLKEEVADFLVQIHPSTERIRWPPNPLAGFGVAKPRNPQRRKVKPRAWGKR